MADAADENAQAKRTRMLATFSPRILTDHFNADERTQIDAIMHIVNCLSESNGAVEVHDDRLDFALAFRRTFADSPKVQEVFFLPFEFEEILTRKND